jgi:hypothetical protein
MSDNIKVTSLKECIMGKIGYLLGAVVLLCATGISMAAAGSSDLTKQNADLKSRVDQLEKEIADIKKSVDQKTGTTTGGKSVWSNLDIQLYGTIKLDADYDSAQIDNGNYAKWVNSGRYNGNDEQFSMTANETRLGALIKGPSSGSTITSGKVEVDFYGTGDAENKPHLMMRHAYLKVEWPDKKFDIIAGQTSDVISPLYPNTLNYTVGWFTGNIGYRRPQIRFTKVFAFETEGNLKLEGAFTRTIGRDNPDLSGTTDSGKDAGFPTMQARASITIPTFGPDMATMGISGHWGQEEYDLSSTNDTHKDFTTWSLNLDYTQPITEKVSVKGEIYTGENLDAYLGGIGQGVNTTRLKSIGDKGGWVAASLGPWDNKKFNVGVAMDNVDGGDVNANVDVGGTHTPGDRTSNHSIFGNVICAINNQTDIGFELSHWRTEYKGPGDAESIRAQLSLMYKF